MLLLAFAGALGCDCGDDRAGSVRDQGQDQAGSPGFGNPDAGVAAERCAEGFYRCDGDVAERCGADGEVLDRIDCAADGMMCMPSIVSEVTGRLVSRGCVACVPGAGSCSDGQAEYCPEDGSGMVAFTCDSVQGMTCEPDGCKGRCAPPEATKSYIGCDYYPTVTLNPVWRGFDYAVSVANAGERTAHVIITRGDAVMTEVDVPVGGVEVIPLPWVMELKGDDVDACQITPDPGQSRVVPGAAYRLRSDGPVTVHQFSPLQYQLRDADGAAPPGCPLGVECSAEFGSTECLSYSNDASLLLPATSLTGDYTVTSWPSVGNTASFYTVTATEDDTDVTVSGGAPTMAGGGIGADGSGVVRLNRGDVLQVVGEHTGTASRSPGTDLSGTRIRASHPVQVIGGHSCAFVPSVDQGECDHIEQALFPSQILGDAYVVSFPAAVASESPHVLRVQALQPDTLVELDPPLVPPFLLSPSDGVWQREIGAWDGAEETPPTDVWVRADGPLVVTQLMKGQQAVPSGSGDPSMALAVPTAQFRRSYVFTAPASYDTSFINIIAPAGASVALDGQAVPGQGSPVGSSDFVVWRVELSSSSAGSHTLQADRPVGLLVYGYGRFTSYMYPGGLDLTPITTVGPL